MKTSNQLPFPDCSGIKTVEDAKVVIQKLVDVLRELHRYVWADLNSGIITIPSGGPSGSSSGGISGRLVKFTDKHAIAPATNTDTDVASAVTKKHTQNTDTGTTGNFSIPAGNGFFIGSVSVDGSWKTDIVDGDYVASKRVNGVWVEKFRFTS